VGTTSEKMDASGGEVGGSVTTSAWP